MSFDVDLMLELGVREHMRILMFEWEVLAASIAPQWATIKFGPMVFGNATGVMTNAGSMGTSWAATMQGLHAAAAGAVPVVVAVGVWVSLGSGYYEARQNARRESTMSGFADGFVAGVLDWQPKHVYNVLVQRKVIYKNTIDSGVDVAETDGYNEGLKTGYKKGASAPDDWKQIYKSALRQLSGVKGPRAWPNDPAVARSMQRHYITDLSSAGRKHGLIRAE